MNTLPPDTTAETSASVCIRLDDQPHTVVAGTTLAELVAALGHPEAAVATVVNTRFVARGQRATYVMQTDDQVLLFQAIVGG